jgi:hypothetical protein
MASKICSIICRIGMPRQDLCSACAAPGLPACSVKTSETGTRRSAGESPRGEVWGTNVAVGLISSDEDACERHRRNISRLGRLRTPENGESIDIPRPPLAIGRPATHIPERDADRDFVRNIPAKPHLGEPQYFAGHAARGVEGARSRPIRYLTNTKPLSKPSSCETPIR